MKTASLLFFTSLIFASIAMAAPAKLPDGYKAIWLARSASPKVQNAAHHLADLLQMDFGQRPSIQRLPLFGQPFGIHIGPDPANSAFDDDPLTDEILLARSSRGLEITGPDNASTVFAVYAFAEEALGWRFFQPGPLGLEKLDQPPPMPKATGEPTVLLLQQAAYLSRNLRGVTPRGFANEAPDWYQWQRLRERFRYNHSLHRVAAPELFQTHPEWFAKNPDGTPRKPFYPYPHGYNDHPDLTHPDLRQWVIDQSIASLTEKTNLVPAQDQDSFPPPPPGGSRPFVRQTPGALSLSLSLGDSYIFGHFPDDYPWKATEWFRHWPDWSNHVFAYTNAVATQIHKAYQNATWPYGPKPELFLGTLSYLVWENVPDFPVHPRIVPYLTFDRSQWYDPAARSDDLRLVRRWADHAHLPPATWDYLFGYGFLIPRSLTKVVADSIPALYQRGLRGYFSQVAALWPYDGHTTYLTARLLWDPQADSNRILDTYYTEFYGPAAAHMRDFFSLAENRWMNQTGEGWWLRHWEDPYQIGLLSPEDLQQLGNHLEQALAATTTARPPAESLPADRFRQRVEEATALFHLTSALHRFQSSVFALQESVNARLFSDNPPPFRSSLDQAAEALRLRADLLATRDRVTQNRPRLAHARRLSWVTKYDNIGGALATLLTTIPNQSPSDRMLRLRAADLLHQWAKDTGEASRRVLPHQPLPEILYDNAFQHIDNPRVWHHQFLPSEDLRTQPSPSGTYQVANVQRGQFYQLFPVQQDSAFLARLDFRTAQSLSGQVQIRLDFLDQNQQSLEADSRRARLLPRTSEDHLQSIATVATPPPEAAFGRIIVRFFMLDRDQPVHLHRAAVHRLPLQPQQNPTPPSP